MKNMHQNSLTAYHDEFAKLSKRSKAIMDYLYRAQVATARQIKEGMGFTDMNSVRPRITELKDANWIEEVGGGTTDEVTGKTVACFRPLSPEQRNKVIQKHMGQQTLGI